MVLAGHRGDEGRRGTGRLQAQRGELPGSPDQGHGRQQRKGGRGLAAVMRSAP